MSETKAGRASITVEAPDDEMAFKLLGLIINRLGDRKE